MHIFKLDIVLIELPPVEMKVATIEKSMQNVMYEKFTRNIVMI